MPANGRRDLIRRLKVKPTPHQHMSHDTLKWTLSKILHALLVTPFTANAPINISLS